MGPRVKHWAVESGFRTLEDRERPGTHRLFLSWNRLGPSESPGFLESEKIRR